MNNPSRKPLEILTVPEVEKLSPDTEEVKEAQEFFRQKGLQIESSGLISQNLTTEQMLDLKKWHEETTTGSGIQLDTIEDFYKKTLLAISLFRQKDTVGPVWLLGKGLGVEVVLQGKVLGRKKKNVAFPYRSHSDFELYGVNNRENDRLFQEIFSGPESFSSESRRTKGLVNLPPDLLNSNFETVDLGGLKILIPELELLFLDKYAAPEQTPRVEGYDAELLAQQYELDKDKVHAYLDPYIIEPAIEAIEIDFRDKCTEQMDAIRDFLSFSVEELEISGGEFSIEDIVKNINSKIREHVERSKSNLKNVSISGLDLFLWEDLRVEDIDLQGKIVDPQFESGLKERVDSWKQVQITRCKDMHIHVDAVLGNNHKGL